MNSDYALIGKLLESLRQSSSWCGQTHIQKAAFVAKIVFDVPLSSTFVLYKHGPYSFDLTNLLTSMRADQVVRLVPQGQYGPSFHVEDRISPLMGRYRDDVESAADGIDRVARFL